MVEINNEDFLAVSKSDKPVKKANTISTGSGLSKEDILALGEAIGKGLAGASKPVQQADITSYQSTQVVDVKINEKIKQKSEQQQDYAKTIANDLQRGVHCHMFSIPKIYKEYQPSFVVSINGCTIKVPADGVSRLIHDDYIALLEKRMRHLDDKIESMNNGATDIKEVI